MKRINYGILVIYVLADCLSFIGAANAGELLPLTDFYDTPDSFANCGKPGDLIRSEAFDGYKLAEGVRAWRILYGTTNSKGKLVTSSGVVLVPSGETPEGGWPVIAWAHGTSGVNRTCAPSLMVEVFSDYRTPNTYTERGYAIVAADYAGLGTEYPLDYLDRISNGWDIIHSVKAARAALPQLGDKWVALGHSAGAHAMRGVAELQAGLDDPSYLGAVSVSGLGDARAPMTFLSKMSPNLATYIIESAGARFSEFEPADVLTEKGLEFFETSRKSCAGPGIGRPTGPRIPGSEVLRENWTLNTYVDSYLKMDESGQEIYKGPLLVINGQEEPPPIFANDLEATRRACEQDIKVQFQEIPGANHFTVLGASLEQQMEWIADRFSGREAPDNCETIRP